jgi:hypothetical protein
MALALSDLWVRAGRCRTKYKYRVIRNMISLVVGIGGGDLVSSALSLTIELTLCLIGD